MSTDNPSGVYPPVFGCAAGGDDGGTPPPSGGGGGNTINLTIPASDVGADLTAFPVVIEHGRHVAFPDHVWDGNGGTISVWQAGEGGVELKSEVVRFNSSTRKLRLHFQTDLSSTVDNEFEIRLATVPSVTGKVFDAYELVTSFYGLDSDDDGTAIQNWAKDGTVFTPSYTVDAHPLFENGFLVCGASRTSIHYQLADTFQLSAVYGVGQGNCYSANGNQLLSFAGTDNHNGRIATSGQGLSQRAEGEFGTFNGGNWIASSTSADIVTGGEVIVSAHSELAVAKTVFLNGGNKTSFNNWILEDDPADFGYIGGTEVSGEIPYGAVREARLANFVPSDEWVAFEALNMKGEALATNTEEGTEAEPVGSLSIGDTVNIFTENRGVDLFTAADGSVWLRGGATVDAADYPDARLGFDGTESLEFNFSQYTTLPEKCLGDEDAIYVLDNAGRVHRLGYDGIRTHLLDEADNYDLLGMAGDYLYLFYDVVSDPLCKRFNKSDLSFVDNLTLPVGILTGAGGDDTHLFVVANGEDADDTILHILNQDGTDAGFDPIALQVQDNAMNNGQRMVQRMNNGNFVILDEFSDDVSYLDPTGRFLSRRSNFGGGQVGEWQRADGSIWGCSTGENVYKITIDQVAASTDDGSYWYGNGLYTRIK